MSSGESNIGREALEDGLYLWVAYYPDWSSVVVFTSELAALRYAVEARSGMWVSRILPGIPIGEQAQ